MFYKKKLTISLLIYVIIFFILFFICDFNSIYNNEYITLLLSYVIVAGIFIISIIKYNTSIFEPITIVFTLLICIFSITPIILTKAGITELFGYYFMDGCIKATIIYELGCISYFLGYYIKIKKINGEINDRNLNSHIPSNNCLIIMYIIWIICFTISIGYQLHIGKNLLYIFSLGKNGSFFNVENIDNSLRFLINFTYSMIFPWLYIIFNSKRTIIKCIISILMIVIYIVYGFRFIIVIMGLSLMATYYLKNKKEPKFLLIVMCLVVGLIIFTYIGNARNNIRNNDNKEVKLNYDSLVYTLQSNFNLYQAFYNVVNKVPEQYSYTYGESIFYNTAIMFVPRVLWKSKPTVFAVNRIMMLCCGSYAGSAGFAMPNIAEYYIDFGIIGVIVFMYIFGKFSKKIIKLMNSNNINNIFLYSILYGSCFQLVIRGYTPSNFYLLLFLTWPYLLTKRKVGK